MRGETAVLDADVDTTAKSFSFGSFQLTSPPTRLSKSGAPVELRPQVLRVLEQLVSRPGEVISRDEIREHLWGSDRFVDHEQGINTIMRELRKALDDDPQDPTFIETVRLHGYRFIARVRILREPLLVQAPARRESPLRSFRRWSKGLLAGLAVAVLLPLGWLAWRKEVALAQPSRIVITHTEAEEGSSEAVGYLTSVLPEVLGSALEAEPSGSFQIVVERPTWDETTRAKALSSADFLILSALEEIPEGYRVELRLLDAAESEVVWVKGYDLAESEIEAWSRSAATNLARQIQRGDD